MQNLSQGVMQQARDLGFDGVSIIPAGPSPGWERYRAWVDAGYAGEMHYLIRHLPLKQDPRALLPSARSIILVTLNYAQPVDEALLQDPSRGRISRYALGRDYHKIMRKALKQLDGWLAAQTGRTQQGRVFVDSAPMLERGWARQSGLGFIGKNGCLIHPQRGSWFFLGGLLAPEALAPGVLPPAKAGACGTCTRCLSACPTDAFVAPQQVDARRCISYLTIEQRGAIPRDLRPKLGNWVFGCDVCQQVCPWNHRAQAATHPQLQPRPELMAPPLLELLALDEAGFLARFAGSPVMRAKWEGFMRNVCVAAGNWGDVAALEALTYHLHHSPPRVAEHAAWALAQLRGDAGLPALMQARDTAPHLRSIIDAELAAPHAKALRRKEKQ